MGFLEKIYNKKSWGIYGFNREEHEEYPTAAIREVLINALIHRDYSIFGSEIYVDLFPDRLEITSPGGMMDGSSIQNLDIGSVPSKRRNQIISNIFSKLHIVEQRGSGLIRFMDEYKKFEIKPQFYSNSSTFRVTLPNTAFDKEIMVDEGVSIQLTEKENEILNLLKENPRISLREIAERTGLSYKIIWKQVNDMRNKGLIEHIGSQKSGYWRILD